MISAMPAVALRRERKRSKTFGRFDAPGSLHSSTTSLGGDGARGSISTIAGRRVAFRRRRVRYDSELDRQRRRFLIYMGTLCLISGLLLVFIGVGSQMPHAQTIGLLLIGVGAVFCIIKVFCSEAHMTDVPVKAVPIIAEPPEPASGGVDRAGGEEDGEATPLANISEFTELRVGEGQESHPPHPNNVTPTSPPNGIPETQVLIGNDSGGRY